MNFRIGLGMFRIQNYFPKNMFQNDPQEGV